MRAVLKRVHWSQADTPFSVWAIPSEGSFEFNAFIRDVETRNRLEEQVRQSQKLEAIGALAGGIAHDFNNILTAIIGHAELALRGSGSETEPATWRSHVEGARDAARHAALLTAQLLTYSRRQVIRPEVVDLNDVVLETRTMLERLIEEAIEIRLVLSPDLIPIRADRGQLAQILTNLVVNARDALPAGGTITISTDQVDISAREAEILVGAAPGRYVCLAVKDNGEGMDAETAAHAFDPFFTTKGEGHGTGLGLSTVYGIVKQNLGYVHLASTPDEGTTIEMYFPPTQEAPRNVEPAEAPRPPGQPKRVLLVEDNDNVRAVVLSMLEAYGHSVTVASNASDALAHLTGTHTVDVVVSDIVMPGMTGLSLAQEVLSRLPDAHIVLMTGFSEDVVGEARRDPRIRLLLKPFSADELAAAIASPP